MGGSFNTEQLNKKIKTLLILNQANERKNDEGKPIGIILCADKDQEDVEYLELDDAGIHVTKYLTQLPPKTVLEQYLHQAIALAKASYQEKDLELNDEI